MIMIFTPELIQARRCERVRKAQRAQLIAQARKNRNSR